MVTNIILSSDAIEKLKQLFSDIDNKENGNDVFSVFINNILNPSKDAG